jgi:hypothetical protein
MEGVCPSGYSPHFFSVEGGGIGLLADLTSLIFFLFTFFFNPA